MYTEVRHAKNSSLSFPKQSEIFRLKKNNRNLDTDMYVKNICTYLSKVTCHVSMDHSDFREAIDKLLSE